APGAGAGGGGRRCAGDRAQLPRGRRLRSEERGQLLRLRTGLREPRRGPRPRRGARPMRALGDGLDLRMPGDPGLRLRPGTLRGRDRPAHEGALMLPTTVQPDLPEWAHAIIDPARTWPGAAPKVRLATDLPRRTSAASSGGARRPMRER